MFRWCTDTVKLGKHHLSDMANFGGLQRLIEEVKNKNEIGTGLKLAVYGIGCYIEGRYVEVCTYIYTYALHSSLQHGITNKLTISKPANYSEMISQL